MELGAVSPAHISPRSLTWTVSPSPGLKASSENRKNKSIDSFLICTFPVGSLTNFIVYSQPSGETLMTRADLGEDRGQCHLVGTQHPPCCATGCGDEGALSASVFGAFFNGNTTGKQCITPTGEFRNQILSVLIIILIKKKNWSFNNNIISFCFSLIKPISFSFLSAEEEECWCVGSYSLKPLTPLSMPDFSLAQSVLWNCNTALLLSLGFLCQRGVLSYKSCSCLADRHLLNDLSTRLVCSYFLFPFSET